MEFKTLGKLAETEMRIYKMYRDISQNELRKEKQGTLNSLQKIIEERFGIEDQASKLRDQNDHLRQAIKRYRGMVANFDEEYHSVKKYVSEKH